MENKLKADRAKIFLPDNTWFGSVLTLLKSSHQDNMKSRLMTVIMMKRSRDDGEFHWRLCVGVLILFPSRIRI